MSEWITPVTDRTSNDVSEAVQAIKNCKNNPQALEELKGCLNVTDMNRIEGNIEYISDVLEQLGYITHCNTKQWVDTANVTRSDADRIINNIKGLYDLISQTPTGYVPTKMRTYQDINDIEKLSLELLNLVVNIRFRYITGDYISDADLPLPKGE